MTDLLSKPTDRNDSLDPEVAVIDELVTIASTAGVSLDRDAARSWLRAVSAAVAAPGEFSRSADGAFGGHELAMLDFDPDVASRLRVIGRMIATPNDTGVSSALAIAGSAAQGRIQPFPADADFFERIHIVAPDRDAAARQFAATLRANIDQTRQRPELHFLEVFLGHRTKTPFVWTPDELEMGRLVRLVDGDEVAVTWEEAARDPGFVKIDWTLADPELGGPGHVSKAIDVTWQPEGGAIQSLDGEIDADYQQVYLDAAAADLAAAITAGLAPGSRDFYLWHMEREIAKYCRESSCDYAKVAKRLYNLCRLTGNFTAAVYIRELFDEPPARLHQLRMRFEMMPLLNEGDRLAVADELDRLSESSRDWYEEPDRALLQNWAADLRATTTDSAKPTTTSDADLQRLVSSAFERTLRAYAPIASLIDDVRARHTDL